MIWKLYSSHEFAIVAPQWDLLNQQSIDQPILESQFIQGCLNHFATGDEVIVHASWSQGFRAPSLAQVGLGPSEESQFFVDSYRCADSGTDCGLLDYNIQFSGNPELEAEESESWNVGVFRAPIPEFVFGFDVWSIEQNNKIDKKQFGGIYDAECNDQASTICVRLPPSSGQRLGVLDKLHGTFENVSSQEVQGVDISANYNLNIGDAGDLKFNLEWAYMSNFEKDNLDYTGEYKYPEHRWIATTNWVMDDLSANMNISYIGEFEDTPDIDFDGTLDFEDNQSRTVDSQILVDLQVAYHLSDSIRLALGVNYVLDEEPPFAIGDGGLYGYASSVHNPRGRIVYTKVSFKF